MGCLVVTENQAYLYNVLSRVMQVHKFSFIRMGKLFCYDGDFLHVLNEGGLETYTTRLLPSCLQVLHRDIKFDGRCAVGSVISLHSDICTNMHGHLKCIFRYVCIFILQLCWFRHRRPSAKYNATSDKGYYTRLLFV